MIQVGVDLEAAHAVLARVLHAVAVVVVEHAAGDGTDVGVAEVLVDVPLAGDVRDDQRLAGGGEGLLPSAEGDLLADVVGAGRNVRKEVIARRVGDGGALGAGDAQRPRVQAAGGEGKGGVPDLELPRPVGVLAVEIR